MILIYIEVMNYFIPNIVTYYDLRNLSADFKSFNIKILIMH